MRSWRISTTSGVLELYALSPPPGHRRGAGLLVSAGGQLAGLLGTPDARISPPGSAGDRVFMTLRGAVGAAIIGSTKEAWTR